MGIWVVGFGWVEGITGVIGGIRCFGDWPSTPPVGSLETPGVPGVPPFAPLMLLLGSQTGSLVQSQQGDCSAAQEKGLVACHRAWAVIPKSFSSLVRIHGLHVMLHLTLVGLDLGRGGGKALAAVLLVSRLAASHLSTASLVPVYASGWLVMDTVWMRDLLHITGWHWSGIGGHHRPNEWGCCFNMAPFLSAPSKTI